MKSAIVGMYDAKTNFSKLVSRAEAGEEIIVSRAGKPGVAQARTEGFWLVTSDAAIRRYDVPWLDAGA